MGRKVKQELTHGRDANQRRTDTSIQPPPQTIPCDTFLDDIDRALVHAALGGLQPDLDEIKGVADNDCADTTKAAGGEGAELLET